MSFYLIIIPALVSFIVLDFFTNPKRKVQNRLPILKIKWVQISPNIRIFVRGRIFYIHHWMSLTLILVVSLVWNNALLDITYIKGLLIGGILHGFTLPEWKDIVKKNKIGLLLLLLRRPF